MQLGTCVEYEVQYSVDDIILKMKREKKKKLQLMMMSTAQCTRN